MHHEWEKNPPFGFKTSEDLFRAFQEHCEKHLREIHLDAKLSQQRILDVFQAWQEDLERGRARNFRDDGVAPGHIKAAAFLTYWLRREAPIVDVCSFEGQYTEFGQLCVECDIGDDEGSLQKVTDEELRDTKLPSGMSLAELLENRKRVFAYGNELFAFTFGFYLAKRYEQQRLKEAGISAEIAMPPLDFVEDICYLFKFKSVSPHAVDLIYRSLLMVRRPTRT